MPITSELLNQNIDGLTEDQAGKIVKLAENAFSQDIAQRIGELHGQYDQDIKSIIGKDKPGGVKTYEWMKNVMSDLKEKAEGGGAELESLKAEKAELEKKLKEKLQNGEASEELKKEIADLTGKVSDWEKKYADESAAWKEKETTWQSQIEKEQAAKTGLRINFEFEKALSGVKFKPDDLIPEAVRTTYIEAAKAKIMSDSKPDWIDDGKGGQRLVFRNANGQILNNPDNALAPYTAKELLAKELDPILDKGKKGAGAGSGGGSGGAGGAGRLSFPAGGFKNQGEAASAIQDHLLALGIENGSQKFQEKFTEIWDENQISALPMR